MPCSFICDPSESPFRGANLRGRGSGFWAMDAILLRVCGNGDDDTSLNGLSRLASAIYRNGLGCIEAARPSQAEIGRSVARKRLPPPFPFQ
jgi:hypothetical protein